MTKKKPTPTKTSAIESGLVPYPSLDVQLFDGDKSLTVDEAKFRLGWEEETETVKFGSNYAIQTPDGVKVRLTKNTNNRPIKTGALLTYAQEILKRRWWLNGETIIIGTNGQILSGQHRLLALVFASLLRKKHLNHWEAEWPNEPTLPCIIVFGVSEEEKVVNTLDTGVPRTLADVIFRSHYFADLPAKDRKDVSRMVDYAIRTLWSRTGAGNDAFTPYRTHSESLDFLDRHPRILEAVKHIAEENAENTIGKFISTGTAAGLMYLMGTSKTDVDEYRNANPAPSEKVVDFKHWDKATEFWVLFGSGNLLEVRHAIAALVNEENGEGGGSLAEKVAIFAKAWGAFLEHGEVKKTDLKLKYRTDDDGIRHFIDEDSLFGGIDLGNERADAEDAPVESELETPAAEPTPEEVEAEKARVREENKAKLLENRKKNPPKPKPATPVETPPVTESTPTEESAPPVEEPAPEAPPVKTPPKPKRKAAGKSGPVVIEH